MSEMFTKQSAAQFTSIAQIGDDGLVELEFKGLGKKAFQAIIDSIGKGEGKRTEAEALAELIIGWNHEHKESLVKVPYSIEALDAMLDEFWTAGFDIVTAYHKGRAAAKKPT
jgi:hypothetical protein